MDKSTLSNYGWVVIVTLVLAVMLALATPFGSYVGRGASNVIKFFTNITEGSVDSDNIKNQSKEWDDYLNDNTEEITDYTPEEIAENPLLFPIGKNQPEYVVAEFNSDFTEVTISKNGKNSDGLMNNWDNNTLTSEKETSSPMYQRRSLVKKAIIKNGVVSIGISAFMECDALTDVIIPNSITNINPYAFFSCGKLNNLDFPDSLTSIGEYAFYGCLSIEELDFPENLTTIERRAFEYCNALTVVKINKNLSNANSSVRLNFNGCQSLENFIVDGNNQDFTSVDGILYNKDMTFMIRYPCGKKDATYTMPSTVTTIQSTSFNDTVYLEHVTFSENLVEVIHTSFNLSSNIKSVTIPGATTTLESAPFANCPKFETIYGIKGSPAETWAINHGFKFEEIQ